ncbi:imidazole glycerol phosphate synthase subunit HisH [Mammaliicoccus stepanovicii]|uniref:Imidazole glycerol phosphate synthase subunit HisH n=1 Tax=Mammaliicoccus stepanovicii TaxID=643214 RepID=A0A239YTW6_9STAP|nr:imidazole glycerol phosphate synthase subunit HisH [Mammaliicoccus stepanovicii]PNZ75895.1 imidazole glycerol phosphate synthase subunit HisH [Mammaliicoccus stepanovicii]GGI42339.1 imidazole glycerol phosphate synthase subunit HisH [Mammaliicoccus stepanovicii]SNV61816.1 imidazole glycerol phosphate synthase subunit HisH [Mammaliicoccus stepanovicii]
MIAIVDYGLGNIKNIERALRYLGYEVILTSNREQILNSTHVILPGVGHFKDAMNELEQQGLDKVIYEIKDSHKIIGICLGMQLLFEYSDEGFTKGLSLLKGKVVPIDSPFPVPHLGWNTLQSNHPSLNEDVYFIHSYHVVTPSTVVATADYGQPITAIVQQDNIIGIQFHPEKSGDFGLKILDLALKEGFIND